MPPSAESAVADFRTRAAALERAGLPVGWAGEAAGKALEAAVRLGADSDGLLEAAVQGGADAASRVRGARRPWFYPALVCAGAALGGVLLAVGLAPFFEQVYAEFRVPPGPGIALVESVRSLAPWILAAGALALGVAWWAAMSRRSRAPVHDPLRTALACRTLAALADAGVAPEGAEEVARSFGPDATAVPFAAWAVGDDLGGVARGEALRLAARVADARAARHAGDSRWVVRLVTASVVAGAAVLAYALVLFLPAVDLFMAISGATGRLAP